MNRLEISSCIEEISECMKQHCRVFEEELRQGAPPDRYETLSLMVQAVKKGLDTLQQVPDFFRNHQNYADENLYPIVRDTYAIKEDFCEEQASIALPKLLIMSGFIAVSLNFLDAAEMIFEALKKFRPENEYPFIGLAYVHLNKGAYALAIEMLRDQALKINPQSDLARAFLALSYTFSKKYEEMKQLTSEIIENNDDQNAIAIARALLSECHFLCE
jgi:tetratricopeptide (TPR) repeat protein